MENINNSKQNNSIFELVDNFVEKYNKYQKVRCAFLLATSILLILSFIMAGLDNEVLKFIFMGTTTAVLAGYLVHSKASKVNRLISMLEATFGILWTIFIIFNQ